MSQVEAATQLISIPAHNSAGVAESHKTVESARSAPLPANSRLAEVARFAEARKSAQDKIVASRSVMASAALKARQNRQEVLAKRIDDIQKSKYPPQEIRFEPETELRRTRQAAFFCQLRELKNSTDLNLNQHQFASDFISVLHKADSLLLNDHFVNCGLTLGQLITAVEAINVVLAPLEISVKVELCLAEEAVKIAEAEPFDVSLLILHPASATVRILGRGLCSDQQSLTEIAHQLNEIYVMY